MRQYISPYSAKASSD